GTPPCSIDTTGRQVFMRLDGAYDDLQKIRDTPIAAGGRTFRLADIADVKRGYEDPPTFLMRHDGEAALVVDVVMQDGWNGLDLGRALNAEEKQIARALPAGRSEEHTSELQSPYDLVCRLLLEKKKKTQ